MDANDLRARQSRPDERQRKPKGRVRAVRAPTPDPRLLPWFRSIEGDAYLLYWQYADR